MIIRIALIAMLLVGSGAVADDGDIAQTEVIPDVVGWKLDTVKFLVITRTCAVTYRKVDINDNSLSEFIVRFQNVADDPETPENEEKTEFTDLIAYIQNQIKNHDKTLQQAIKQAVKIKLGIE